MELDINHIREILYQHGYEYKNTIGKGGFSNVFLCHSKKYDFDFAVKRAIKNKLTLDEYNTLISLTHPNIVRLYDAFEEESAQYLVMEYCPIGSINQKGKLSYEQFVNYSKQILEALSYCHSLNIAHRDIKPENIFLDQNNNVRLADFGMAKHFDFDDKSDEKCGSLKYFSPEMFQFKEVCPFKADIWALGVTFFSMATGDYPFKGNSPDDLKQNVIKGNFDFDKYDVDVRIRFLIMKMTQQNPDLRQIPEKLLRLPMYNPLTRQKKLSSAVGISSRNSYYGTFRPKTRSRSMNFSSLHCSSSDDEQKTSSPLTKLNSFKSISHLPPLQQVNCTFQSSKLV
ncbi:hypothetical protein M9Y10_037142 [Tritrichomonas musculus]|uniref:Protein kinase domain-containing protein n=1 Tax=Tritrichomonas musculus TaxID=1915356 RepID=A0ABR2GT16_9EUKA